MSDINTKFRQAQPDLRSLSMQTLHASATPPAHEEIAETAFDLVVVDMQLPDGNGCTLVSELRESCPNLPALFVSGRVDDKVRPSSHRGIPRSSKTIQR